MYAIINPQTMSVSEFPIRSLKRRFPATSFPKNPSATSLPPEIVPVEMAEKPSMDLFQKAEMGQPQYNSSTKKWTCGYNVVAMTSEEQATEMTRLQDEVRRVAQERLDAFAREKNYDNIVSACSYANSSDPTFSQEGQRACDVRDAVWAGLYDYLGQIESGTVAMPTTKDELYANIPEMTWA